MKKTLGTLLVAVLAATAVSAQDIPERKTGDHKRIEKRGMHGKRPHSSLNLTDEQKAQVKSLNQDLHKKMADLKKQDQLTVKEYRERMTTLRKEHRSQFESLLTSEQKAQMQKDREARKTRSEEFGKKREARMKEDLKLSDEQSAKLSQMRKATREKISAIRSNASLSDEQKKEQVKDVMKKQQDEMKSVLTEDQLKKMKERKGYRGKKKGIS